MACVINIHVRQYSSIVRNFGRRWPTRKRLYALQVTWLDSNKWRYSLSDDDRTIGLYCLLHPGFAVILMCIWHKGKGLVALLWLECRRGAHLPFQRPWARRWKYHYYLWRMASATPDLRLPSQLVLVPNYTAWWQRHMCVNSLTKAAPKTTAAESQPRDMLIASPAPYHYATEPHMPNKILYY